MTLPYNKAAPVASDQVSIKSVGQASVRSASSAINFMGAWQISTAVNLAQCSEPFLGQRRGSEKVRKIEFFNVYCFHATQGTRCTEIDNLLIILAEGRSSHQHQHQVIFPQSSGGITHPRLNALILIRERDGVAVHQSHFNPRDKNPIITAEVTKTKGVIFI